MKNGGIWPDSSGVHINAHGGGIIYHLGTYYWYGEFKTEGWEGRLAWHGVSCYRSGDLLNWENCGIVLQVSNDLSSPIRKGCRIERPKVLYNKLTGKFVMWFHSTDANHTLARSGVAVADHPEGPFEFLYARRPDAGKWPLDVTLEDRDVSFITAAATLGESAFSGGESDRTRVHNILGRDVVAGQMARDMNLFVDDDGSAYHIHTSEHNSTLHIARLTGDYLDHAVFTRAFRHRWMEAPAMFKRCGRYYMIMSGCTGWDPNAARAGTADDILGRWSELPNPCRGINPLNKLGAEHTFGSQSTFVLQVPDTDRYIAMFDLWNPKNFIDSRYLWLPIDFAPDGSWSIPWRDEIF